MPEPITCAKCGKILSDWEMENGGNRHICKKQEKLKRRISSFRQEHPIVEDNMENISNSCKEIKQDLQECPNCSNKSLWLNNAWLYWECLNLTCRVQFSEKELIEIKGRRQVLDITIIDETSLNEVNIDPDTRKEQTQKKRSWRWWNKGKKV